MAHKDLGAAFVLAAAVVFAACTAKTTSMVTDTSSTLPDSGTGDDDASDTDAGDPFAGPTVCTSGSKWTHGDNGSALMHPGRACLACHAENHGPDLTVGGTVFPTGHEPDDCNGVSGSTADVTVVITDAKGKAHSYTPNTAGNFSTSDTIPTPFTVKLVSGDKERVMNTPQTSGDCNGCHTVAGTNTAAGADPAPGRIVAP